MATFDNLNVAGPLFEPGTDLLAIAEELLDLRPGQTKRRSDMTGNKDRHVDRLIMMDIARSLRDIARRPQVCKGLHKSNPPTKENP